MTANSPAPAVGVDGEAADADEAFFLCLPEADLGHDGHIPVVVDVAGTDVHGVADVLEILVEPGADGRLRDGGEHLMLQRLVLGTDGPEDHLGSVGQAPGGDVAGGIGGDDQMRVGGDAFPMEHS